MIRETLTVSALILAVLLVVSAAGCSSVELTQQKSSEITLPEETEDAPVLDQSDAEYDNVKTWSWAPYETLYRTDGLRMGLVRGPMVRGTSVKFQTRRSGFG